MVKAVASVEDTQRFELKSLPGAYVVLRRMTYGQKLARQAEVSKMRVATQRGSKDLAAEMQMLTEATAIAEFRYCVIEHNLEADDEGNLLNLANPSDVQRLDPRVGEEISTRIGEMNNFEDEETEQGNS